MHKLCTDFAFANSSKSYYRGISIWSKWWTDTYSRLTCPDAFYFKRSKPNNQSNYSNNCNLELEWIAERWCDWEKTRKTNSHSMTCFPDSVFFNKQWRVSVFLFCLLDVRMGPRPLARFDFHRGQGHAVQAGCQAGSGWIRRRSQLY